MAVTEQIIPSKCAFCDETKLTHEHIWGKWINKAFGIVVHKQSKVFHGVRHNGTRGRKPRELGMIRKGQLAKNGVSGHIKKRVVCASCNNGWMSQLENLAKPIILNISKYSFNTRIPDDCKILSRWCSQKAFLFTYCELLKSPFLGNETIDIQEEWLRGSSPYALKTEDVPKHYTVAICAITPESKGMSNLYYDMRNSNGRTVAFAMFGSVGSLGFWVTTTTHGRSALFKLQLESKGSVRVISPLTYTARLKDNQVLKRDWAERSLERVIDYPVEFISNQFEMR